MWILLVTMTACSPNKLIDNNVWLNQDQIVTLYQSSKSNISEHIKHILEEGELDSNSVVRNFRITATDGEIYNVKHCNLDMIIESIRNLV